VAGTFSHYLENKLLDHVFGGGDFSRPSTVYFALFTVAPSDAGGGTEVSGGGYARAAVTNNSTNFPAADNGAKENAVEVVFPHATGDWGEVEAVGLLDASTAGNLLAWALLGEAKNVISGDVPRLAPGDVSFTLD
jgi:hypothetical protein